MPRGKKSEENTLEQLFESGVIKKGNDEEFVYSRVSFGIPLLDELTGGGVPTKRLTLVTGQSNAGKSYLCSQLVKTVQEKGGTAAWMDAEWSWDANWMSKCGVNCDTILVSQPESGEAAFDVIRELMKNKINLIILDSVAALVPAELNTEAFNHNPMANKARLINNGISRLFPHLKNGTALVFINQLRSGIGPYALDVYPGGEGQSFFAHMILQVRRSGWIEESKEKVGFEIEVRQRKSKISGASYDSVVVPFRLEGGIDQMEIMIGDMIDAGVIEKSGMWFSIEGNEKKISGRNGVKEYLVQNPEVYEKLKAKLTE